MLSSANAYGAALSATKLITDGAAVSTTNLAASFSSLTPAKIANLAVTKSLSEAQLKEALNTSTLTLEQKKEVLAHYNAAAAKGVDKAATDALSFSLKNLWVACKPFIILTAIAVAAQALYKAWDKANITAEEQRDIFNDLQTTYSETKSTLESLKDEYDSINEKLEELNRLASLGALTASQQEELIALQGKSAEIERQIKLQEKLAGVQEKATNDAAYEALIKRRNKTDGLTMRRGSEVISSGGGSEMNDVDAIQHYLDKLEDASERKAQLDAEWAAKINPTTQDAEDYATAINAIETEMANYESKISDIVTAVTPFLNSITDTSGAAYDLKVALEAVIDKWVNFESGADDAAVALSNIVTTTYRLFPELEAHTKSLTTVESTITDLRDALADFRDDGYVTMDAFSDMSETFGKFPDEFERFVSVASNSKSTMSEVKAAANDLAEAYLASTDFLSNMTDGTIDATIATLKNIGVVNAEEVVMNRVAASKAETMLESANLANAEWDEAKKHLTNVGAAEKEITALLQLRQAKLNTKLATTDFVAATSDTISALILEAQAAGMATNNLAALLRLKNDVASGRMDGMLFSERTERLNNILGALQNDINKLPAVDLGLNLNLAPTPSNGKTAAEKAAEEVRDAFEKVYSAKKHELDMEKITIEEFYAWLDGEEGYKAYFKEQGETLSDFQKYSKEVFDGLREVHQTYLDVFDYEISVIERAENSENELIAKYNQKRASVTELIKELRKYLELQGMTEVEIISNDQYRTYLEMLYTIEDEITSIQDEVYEKQSGYVNDLIDLTEEYIRQVKEDEIDALEETKNAFSDLVSLQKELINGAREEEQYERQKNEKLKQMQKLQERISALELDDSRSAALEKGKLLEELNALQIELNDLQTEHYIDSVETSLDKEEQEFEKAQDAKIKEIEDFLDDNAAVNRAALNELDKMNQDLFDRLESYALHYTDTTRDELLKMWEEVTAAAEKYGSVTNAASVYEDSDVNNAVKTQLDRMRRNGQEYGSASDSRKEWLANDSKAAGAELERLLGVPVRRDENGVWWIGSGTSRKKLFDVYHSGTPSVGGHATFKQNETFALLENGESVFTKKQVNALWDILSKFNPSNLLGATTIIPKLYGTSSQAQTTQTNIEVSMPLTLYGTMDDSVMEVLGRHGREVANLVASKILK